MPSARDLSDRWGISPHVIGTSVPRCFGTITSQGRITFVNYFTVEEANAIREHLLSHRIHFRGHRDVPNLIARLQIPYIEISPNSVSSAASLDSINIGIGCDPEFEVNDQHGRFVAFRGENGREIEVGTDGDGRTGELRPQWDNNPLIVYNHISDLLDTVKSRINGQHVVVAGEGKNVPTGGHIHISGIGAHPTSSMLNALDLFIAIPIRDRCNGDRRNTGYAALGMYRVQFHGGFEYRSSPSWLAHPILTKGALVIAAILAQNHTNLPASKDELADLANNTEERVAIESFYAFLGAMEKDGKYLESLEVLRMWGKRKAIAIPVQQQILPSRDFLLHLSTDPGMPREMRWHQECSFYFIGAGTHRPNPDGIYISRNIWSTALQNALYNRGFPLLLWEREEIGIGRSLRDDGRAEEAIRTLLEEIERDDFHVDFAT